MGLILCVACNCPKDMSKRKTATLNVCEKRRAPLVFHVLFLFSTQPFGVLIHLHCNLLLLSSFLVFFALFFSFHLCLCKIGLDFLVIVRLRRQLTPFQKAGPLKLQIQFMEHHLEISETS